MFVTPKKLAKLTSKLDPERIYVENIRAILGTNTRLAKWICELAVKKGYFDKYYAVECPNDSCNRIIQSYSNINDIPDTISCFICEDDGEEMSTFNTKNLNIIPFYKYVAGSYSFA